jgi:ribonuclease-3
MEILEFQRINNLTFNDQEILKQSLTHPSYRNEHPQVTQEDNERLEFLGDAVLDFVCGEWLYHIYPQATEGYLTRLRSALVRTETLAEFAVSCHIGEVLLLGKGERENKGYLRTGNLCAAFEAILGALYLDQNLEAVKKFVVPLLESALPKILADDRDRDAKSQLQEWAQSRLGILPQYETIEAAGPDHAKQFIVQVTVSDQIRAVGHGSSKQVAAQEAAQHALEYLLENSFQT